MSKIAKTQPYYRLRKATRKFDLIEGQRGVKHDIRNDPLHLAKNQRWPLIYKSYLCPRSRLISQLADYLRIVITISIRIRADNTTQLYIL